MTKPGLRRTISLVRSNSNYDVLKEEPTWTGSYEGSWTWFEAAIVRDFVQDVSDQRLVKVDNRILQGLEAQGEDVYSPLTTVKNPHCDSGADRWHVQSNIRAHCEAVRHTILWTDKIVDDIDEQALYTETGSKSGRGFIGSLEMGDRIAVIARAKVGFLAFRPITIKV